MVERRKIKMENCKKEDKFISFSIAPYCLPKLLLSFYQNGIHNFSITQQDNDLCVSVSVDNLEEIAYKRTRQQEECKSAVLMPLWEKPENNSAKIPPEDCKGVLVLSKEQCLRKLKGDREKNGKYE